MTGGDERKPREFFTRALMRICERLDEQNAYELHWKERFLRRDLSGVLRAESLWVVGSYARGAATCGDLDLVLKLARVEGAHAGISRFVSEALPRGRGVRYYDGDPQVNSSGVSFPDAVQIWSPGAQWRSAIETIVLDPSAGRFSRSTDEFSLRVEQLHAEVEDIEALLELRKSDEISWCFIPVDPAEPCRPVAAEWEEDVLRYMHRSGRNTRKLLPYVLEYLRTHGEPLHSRLSHRSNITELQIEGTFISLARAALNHDLLDTTEVSRILLFPHFSSRGPNGMLELRRGAKHPLEVRTHDLSAYVLRNADGALMRECYATLLNSRCELISLFFTAEQARQYAVNESEAVDPESEPSLVAGTALLDALSYADAIDVHKVDGEVEALVLTHTGRVVFGEHDESVRIAPVDQVLDALADKGRS